MNSDELRAKAREMRRLADHPGVKGNQELMYRSRADAYERSAKMLDDNANKPKAPKKPVIANAEAEYLTDTIPAAEPIASTPTPQTTKVPGSTVTSYSEWERSIKSSREAGGYTHNVPYDSNKPENMPVLSEKTENIDISEKPELNTVDTNPTPQHTKTIDYQLWRERIQLSTGRGLYGHTLTNALMGFNHRNVSDPLPSGRDYASTVFFVRPGINLSPINVENSRRWVDKIRQPKSSIDYSAMAALDVMFPYGFATPEEARIGKSFLPEVLFDNKQAFIPIMSRLCTSVSGFADNSVDSWVSTEGVKREQFGLVDSTWEINDRRTLSTTFNPMVGNPIVNIITIWLEYMAGRKEGRFQKRIADWAQRRVDYFSAIYSIKTDPLGRIVQFDVACECYPTNNNAGALANQDFTKWSTEQEPITIQWDVYGMRYFDPLYMERFNRTVGITNPDMLVDPEADQSDGFVPMGAAYLRKLTPAEATVCNGYGYPHIDTERRTLDWYIYQDQYEFLMKAGGLL